MDGKTIKQLLRSEKEYQKRKQARKEKEQLIPSDYICSQCNEYRDVYPKNWVIKSIGLIICRQCDSKISVNQDWLQLNKKERIDLVCNTIFQHEQMFRKICRFDDEIFDNAVIDRIENFIDNYDPSRGILYSYLKNAVGWYAYKAANVRARYRARIFLSGADPTSEIDNPDYVVDNFDGYTLRDEQIAKRKGSRLPKHREFAEKGEDAYAYLDETIEKVDHNRYSKYADYSTPVFELLESLHPFDQWLIEQHIINGWSQEELAKAAKRSKATINVWIAKVCDKLRREYKAQEE